jgi:hypothetical protein
MLIENIKIEARVAHMPDEVAATVAIDSHMSTENLGELLALLEEIFSDSFAINCKIVAESSNDFSAKQEVRK